MTKGCNDLKLSILVDGTKYSSSEITLKKIALLRLQTIEMSSCLSAIL